MPSMEILVVVATVVLCLLVLAGSFLRFSRGHGARPVLRGVGTVLALVGLYLSGLSGLAGNGIRSIVDWARRTVLGTGMQVGFILLGLGLVLVLVGTVLRPRTKEQRQAVRNRRRGPAVTATAPAPATRPAAAPAAADEDDEIAAILDKRGIH